MILPSFLKILIKAFLVPVCAVLALNKFNIFEFISLVPIDKQFDLGLTAYLALFEALFLFAETKLNAHTAKISLIFYTQKSYKDIKNIPKIVCDQSSSHVANISCDIHISGNTKLLRKTRLTLSLPSWVSSQVSASEVVLSYSDDTIIWSFSNLLANSGEKECHAEHTISIPFIDQETVSCSSLLLKPELNGRFSKYRISFECNGFQLCNREH